MNAGVPIIIGGIILSIVGIIVIHLGTKDKERPRKVYGSQVYANLCEFQTFVSNCEINIISFDMITERLMIERARDEMEDVVFNNKVGEIQKIFEHRFMFYFPQSFNI